MTKLNTINDDTAQDLEERIAHWLREYIAGILALPQEEIRIDAPFHQLGLDSSSAVAMTGDLSDWLGCEIDPSAAYEHSTILKLSHAVSKEYPNGRNAR